MLILLSRLADDCVTMLVTFVVQLLAKLVCFKLTVDLFISIQLRVCLFLDFIGSLLHSQLCLRLLPLASPYILRDVVVFVH